ncbi:MAG: gliding motility-associated C-terminal domain-containing protein [Bacteroidetes bacterium]|nr:MAG: gliding motility-associated C-terminal domain-containing protein [Bacteroidota bacterium]
MIRLGIFWILFISFFLRAQQKQGNYWVWGIRSSLDFTTTPPLTLNQFDFGAFTNDGVTTVSDSLGNFLFFSNSIGIYSGRPDFNPITLNTVFFPIRYTSSLATQIPEKKDEYLIHSLTSENKLVVNKLKCTGLNCVLNGTTDSLIESNLNQTKICLLKKENDKDFWLFTMNETNNLFKVFSITNRGIDFSHNIDITDFLVDTTDLSHLKSSPNSNYISLIKKNQNNFINIFKINRRNGQISERVKLNNSSTLPTNSNYSAFSPNNNKFYVKNGNNLIQYDISVFDSTLISNSRIVSFTLLEFYDMQIGLNGKLYLNTNAISFGTGDFSVFGGASIFAINCPDLPANSPLFSISNQPVTYNGIYTLTLFDFPVQNQTFFENAAILQAIASKRTLCMGDTSRISAFGAGADIFSWAPAAGLNTTTGANVIATPTVTTTYTVSGTGACNNSIATVRIDVLPKVNIVSTFTGLPVCAGGQVQLLATITGASSFSWGTLAGLGIQTNTSVSSSTLFTSVDYRTPTSINATQVILSASNAACFAKDTLKIPLLSAIQNLSFAGNNLSFCSSLKAFGGNTTLVSALFPVSQNRYTWQQLNGNNNGISILESNSIPATFSGIFVSTTPSIRTADFSLAVNNTLSGCTSLDTLTIQLLAQPILPTITGRSSLCPEVQNMPYALLAPLPLQSVYSWSVSGGSLALPTSLPSAIVNWSATPQIGTIAVQSVFTTSGCSSNIAFFTTTINPTINTQTPQGSGENIFCTLQNTSQVFSVPTFAGSVFNWNMRYQPDGLSNISSFVKTSTGVFGNFNQNFSASGIYLIQVQEIVNTASSRCVATSDVLTITAFASPKLNQQLILPDSICGNAQQVTASFTGFVGSVYDWSISGGLASTLSGINLNQITLTFSGLTNPLILSVQQKTFNNCKGNSISKTMDLFPVPKPSTFTGSTQFCGQLPQRSLYTINGNATSTYQWKLDDLLAYTSTGTTFDFPFVNVPIKEKYIVSATETSKNGCVGTKNELPIQLDIINLSLVGTSFFDDSDNKIRIDFALQSLINRSIETFYTRVLGNTSFKSNSSIVDSPFLDTLFLLGNADLKYTVFSKNLCGDTLNTQTHQPIFLKASVDTSVGTVILQWNTYKINKTKISQSYVVWQRNINQPWNELTAVSDSLATLEVAKLGEFQQFKVSTQIGNYLSFSNTSPVLRFNSNIKIYTAFTPNEDGKNDTWVIERLNLYPSNELLITDKFSNIVFRAKPYLNNWNASEMSEGLYYYILYLNNNSKPIIGTVNVIR